MILSEDIHCKSALFLLSFLVKIVREVHAQVQFQIQEASVSKQRPLEKPETDALCLPCFLGKNCVQSACACLVYRFLQIRFGAKTS